MHFAFGIVTDPALRIYRVLNVEREYENASEFFISYLDNLSCVVMASFMPHFGYGTGADGWFVS